MRRTRRAISTSPRRPAAAIPIITHRPPSVAISVAWRNVEGKPIASRTTSAPRWPVSSRTSLNWVGGGGVDRVGRADPLGRLQFFGVDVDGHDPPGAERPGELDDVEADAAGADHGDCLALLEIGDVAQRAERSQQRATEDCRVGQGKLVGDDGDGELRHHRQLAEAAHRVHRDRSAIGLEQPRAPVVERAAQAILGEERLAQLLASADAIPAPSARHDERGDDTVALAHTANSVAESDDGSRHLMSEHAGQRELDIAFVHVQVAVADAAGSDADQDLARLRVPGREAPRRRTAPRFRGRPRLASRVF